MMGQFMWHGWRRIWVCVLALVLAGCRNRDLVENELRARDTQFREAVEEFYGLRLG